MQTQPCDTEGAVVPGAFGICPGVFRALLHHEGIDSRKHHIVPGTLVFKGVQHLMDPDRAYRRLQQTVHPADHLSEMISGKGGFHGVLKPEGQTGLRGTVHDVAQLSGAAFRSIENGIENLPRRQAAEKPPPEGYKGGIAFSIIGQDLGHIHLCERTREKSIQVFGGQNQFMLLHRDSFLLLYDIIIFELNHL